MVISFGLHIRDFRTLNLCCSSTCFALFSVRFSYFPLGNLRLHRAGLLRGQNFLFLRAKIMCCRIVTRLNPLAFLPIMRTVSINGARKMKLLDIDKHFDIIDFIRIHSEELYLGYKTFIRIFGPLDDTHHLIKIVAELESDYTRN